ncbi:MAG TPA: response regulator [Polyangiaceae bacterium]|nr:response regulator [Polyangiaceae bacterium]
MSRSNPPSHMRQARPVLRVVLVDDDANVVRGFRRAIQTARPDWQITTYTEPARALVHLEHQPVDVLVSDYEMPLMSGVDLLRRTRRMHPTVLRVILSGKAQEGVGSVPRGLVHAWLSKSGGALALIALLETELDEQVKLKLSSDAS